MPKGYDFSVRNVDWSEYKNDYILRTDAVWEKSKLMDVFHVLYKNPLIYDPLGNRYYITDIKNNPSPVSEYDMFEDWRVFFGYTDVDGCIFQFNSGPALQAPSSLSKFISDKEGDSWMLCQMSFQKFMICNERSPIKMDEAHLHNGGFFDYPCFDQLNALTENCG
mmetsp:Transcript_17524/g.29551  ORF Transcript_17524/g.29551 Transcript_17524/m.29551 type:complete len:165 (+) Transcript_17524:163-657(+)